MTLQGEPGEIPRVVLHPRAMIFRVSLEVAQANGHARGETRTIIAHEPIQGRRPMVGWIGRNGLGTTTHPSPMQIKFEIHRQSNQRSTKLAFVTWEAVL